MVVAVLLLWLWWWAAGSRGGCWYLDDPAAVRLWIYGSVSASRAAPGR